MYLDLKMVQYMLFIALGVGMCLVFSIYTHYMVRKIFEIQGLKK